MAMAAHRSLSLHNTSLITPSQPSSSSLPALRLSQFDLLGQCFQYNQRILLYNHHPQHTDFPSFLHNLKASLSHVLVHFSPLAGRLGFLPHRHPGCLHVLCNDAGVEFIEASTDATLAELVHCRKPPILYELAPRNGAMNLDGFHLPLLIVQVTKLGGGGIALGLTMNHLLADGNSTWHFINSWAELCRGKSSISLMPVYDRSLLEMEEDCAHTYPPKGFQRIAQSPELQETVLHFSSEAIAEMKQQTNRASKDGEIYSTYQALSAHLWKWMTRARRVGPEEMSRFKAAVDCRRRVLPPVPQAYFGNALIIISPPATGKDLEHQDVSYAASLLKKAIENCNGETIRFTMEEMKRKGQVFDRFTWGANDISVSSSFRFPAYESDFGWGKPVAVRSGLGNKCDGKITLFPGYEGGGSVDAEIMLHADAIQNLEQLIVGETTDKPLLLSISSPTTCSSC